MHGLFYTVPTIGTFTLATKANLSDIVEETVALYRVDGKPLPPPTSGRDYANKMQSVA